MILTDPRTTSAPAFLSGAARMLNDARDTSVILLIFKYTLVAAVGASLFIWPYWLRYYLRFLFFGLPELIFYFYERKNWKLFRRVLLGEGVYWSVVGLGLWLRPEATLTVLVVPLVLIRTLMMMGNWTQHSFISQE